MAEWYAFETGQARNVDQSIRREGVCVYVNEWGARQYWDGSWKGMCPPDVAVAMPDGSLPLEWYGFETGAERNARPDIRRAGVAIYVNEWGARQYWDGVNWKPLAPALGAASIPDTEPEPPIDILPPHVPPTINTDLFYNPFSMWGMQHRPIGKGVKFGLPPGVPKGSEGNVSAYRGGKEGQRGRIGDLGALRLGLAPVGRKYLWDTRTSQLVNMTIKHGKGEVTLRINRDGDNCYYIDGDGDFQALWFPRDGNYDTKILDTCTGFRYSEQKANVYKWWRLDGVDYWDKTDGSLDGTSAANNRWPFGFCRGFEFNDAELLTPIEHALQMTVTRQNNFPNTHILGKLSCFPAYGQDGGASSAEDNLGDALYGMCCTMTEDDYQAVLRMLPSRNNRGRRLVDAIYYYGIYIVDGQGVIVDGKGVGQLRCDGTVGFTNTGSRIVGVQEDMESALDLCKNKLWGVFNPATYDDPRGPLVNGLPFVGGGGPRNSAEPWRSRNTGFDVVGARY